ncbi:MAG: DapH/DapD/GlmU-related protein [bacterium]
MRKYYVHSSSYVERKVEIGAGTTIWYFCHVREGARIGKDCNIGQNVYVGKGVVIGDGVKIQNNVSVYEKVTIEDHVFCGPSVVFTNDPDPRSAYAKDPETDHLPTLVREGATVCANATILCDLTIGRHAFVGAGAVVTRDVPDYALVYGNPARLKGWVCECGAKLELKKGKATCRRCDLSYVRGGAEGLKRA